MTDTAPERDLRQAVETMRNHRIRMELGKHIPETFADAHLVVISPGVAHTIEPLELARRSGAAVVGEVELASRFIREPVVAVTGTNGKTTTTRLVGEMLERSGKNVFVGGNIGCPLIDYVQQKNKADVIVAEISSFQLDTIETFRPHIGVLLNISADHLDRYPDLQAYARSKARLFENQRSDDVAILNGSDKLTMESTAHIGSRKLVFTAANGDGPTSREGAVVSAEGIEFRLSTSFAGLNGCKEPSTNSDSCQTRIRTSQIGLFGRHNLENAAAAALAAMAAGGNWKGVRTTLQHFRGLAHRLEFVATVDDVRYYNDSKATNADAVARALQCFDEPVILLMGGRNKGIEFQPLAAMIRLGVKRVVAFGEAREEIKAAFNGLVPISMAAAMDEAVENARRTAAPGDVVLLSPACASFDMYAGYAQRGDDFRSVVAKLCG